MAKLTKILSLALVLSLSVLTGCGGKNAAGGASAGLEVDPATLQFPLAETATIKGLTNFPAGTESEPNNRTIFKRLKDGCFSGSAVEMPDGRHLLMYTGVRNVRRRNGKVDSFQTQCIAIGDGVNYEKYPGNPVIPTEQIPEGGSTTDFRDNVQAIDYGLDFYAPQTLETYGGRRVMVAWMQNWETCGSHLPQQRFMGQMTLPRELSIRIDRTQSGLPCDIVNLREFPVHAVDGKLKLRLILDRYSVELFVNDGEQAATSVIYTPLDAKSISFSCDGTVLVDVEKYDLEV